MKSTKSFLILNIMIILIMLSSCVKDEYYLQNLKNPEWDPNFAAPLINSRLTIWDILNDYDSTNVFVEDGTNFLYLVYTSQVFSQSAEELIQISDQMMNAAHSFNTGGTIAQGDSFVSTFTYIYDFSFPSAQIIDSVFLKSGNMNVSINTNFNMAGKIEIEFPGTKNGSPFIERINMPGPNNSQNISLGNTKLIFNHSGGNNRLELKFRVVLYGAGNANLSPYNVTIAGSFSNMQFKSLFGYLGQLNFALNEDTVTVKIYDNNIEGIINWEDPRFYLTVTNYLGMPVRVNINLLEAYRTKAPVGSVQITGSGIPNPWNISYPTFSQIGQGVLTTMQLDKTNSNIHNAFNISPQKINALLDAVSNPSGFSQNFAFDTSRFVVDAKVELPMHGTAEGFIISDTIELNLGKDFEDSRHIDWVLFKIYCENQFPVDAMLQIYFTDENFVIVDSLLAPPQQFIHAATPGPPPDYIVTQKYTKVISTKIYNNRIKEYYRIKNAIVHAHLNTYNNASQIVKFYSYYQMHVMLGAQVQLNFN